MIGLAKSKRCSNEQQIDRMWVSACHLMVARAAGEFEHFRYLQYLLSWIKFWSNPYEW